MREMDPRYQTATARREARKDIRSTLGPSSDPAPGPLTALRATARMADLLLDATGGRYRIQLVRADGEEMTAGAALSDETWADRDRRDRRRIATHPDRPHVVGSGDERNLHLYGREGS